MRDLPTIAPRDPLTLLRELREHCSEPVAGTQWAALLSEIDQRLAAGAEADQLAEFANNLAANQHSLPPEMADVLYANLDKLYRGKALAPGGREPVGYINSLSIEGLADARQLSGRPNHIRAQIAAAPGEGFDAPLYLRPQPPSAPQAERMTLMVDAAMVEMQNISPPMRRSECERLIKAALAASPEPSPPSGWTAEALAREFHDLYETAAADHGYVTRPETRTFDPESPNGRLMIDVCYNILRKLAPSSEQPKAAT